LANEVSARIAEEVLKASRQGPPVAVATVIQSPQADGPSVGQKLLVRPDGSRLGAVAGGLDAAVAEDCLEALGRLPRTLVQSRWYWLDGERVHRLDAIAGDAIEVMIEVFEAPVTLLIVGGGHIGLSLAIIGAHLGFSVAVIDDREMYASRERFPMADYVQAGELDVLLQDYPIGPNTYVVLVSRGHKQDELALRQVVRANAAYIGMIGSKRRVSTVLRHLAEEGYPVDALERVYTPIGIDIGAETPEEIAVSILAEIVMVRRGGSGRQMRDGRPRIRPGLVEDATP
jgi:xanthine dehydrogenase accessory factor